MGDNIKLYEPKLALDGGSDGYKEIKKIIYKSSKLLKYNGNEITLLTLEQRESINAITGVFAKQKIEKWRLVYVVGKAG